MSANFKLKNVNKMTYTQGKKRLGWDTSFFLLKKILFAFAFNALTTSSLVIVITEFIRYSKSYLISTFTIIELININISSEAYLKLILTGSLFSILLKIIFEVNCRYFVTFQRDAGYIVYLYILWIEIFIKRKQWEGWN